MTTESEKDATGEYIRNVIWNAVRAYRKARLVDGEIILFRAKELAFLPYSDIATGWDRIGSVRVFDVPGDHESLFRDPGAQAIIRCVLEAAHQRSSGSNWNSKAPTNS